MPKKLMLIATVFLSVNIIAVCLLIYILLEGSGKDGEPPYIKDITPETYAMPRKTEQGMGQNAGESAGELNAEESTGKNDIRPPHSPYVDFSYIEENHEILEYDICADPKYDWESTPLEEHLREDVEDDKRMHEAGYVKYPVVVDYFLFDFNDDGLEDYLVCMDGVLFSGSGGNMVEIYVQEDDGSLRCIFHIHDRLHLPDEQPYSAV